MINYAYLWGTIKIKTRVKWEKAIKRTSSSRASVQVVRRGRRNIKPWSHISDEDRHQLKIRPAQCGHSSFCSAGSGVAPLGRSPHHRPTSSEERISLRALQGDIVRRSILSADRLIRRSILHCTQHFMIVIIHAFIITTSTSDFQRDTIAIRQEGMGGGQCRLHNLLRMILRLCLLI